MSINEALSSEKLGSIKRRQYADKVILSGTVVAGATTRFTASITSLGDFYSLFITGRFTTLALAGNDIVDDGVCALRGSLIDGTGSRKMFNDFIPLDLLFSPGRIKSALAENNSVDFGTVLRADPANNLFYPYEFQHMFDVNSTIIFEVKNDSDADNSFDLVFHGLRLLK
jgi:hypothetical protein